MHNNKSYNKFNVQIFLSCIAVESNPSKKGDSKFLVVSNNGKYEFPNKFLSRSETSRDIATELLIDYTGVTLDWAVLFSFGIIDSVDPLKDTIHILYGVFIPEPTRIRKEQSIWLSYNDISTNEDVTELTKKMAYESIWRNV
jgi:hypothetical protein